MSERSNHQEDNLPTMRLTIRDREYEATPENTSLFRFMGKLAMFDHIFLATDEHPDGEDTPIGGLYIFRDIDLFDDIEDFMLEHDYPMHLNLREVAQCDYDAHQKYITQCVEEESVELPDEFNLEDWTNGG